MTQSTDHVRGDVRDTSRLRISDGVIHYRLYAQDGSMVPMTVADSLSARLLVSWIQIHDRYGSAPSADDVTPPPESV